MIIKALLRGTVGFLRRLTSVLEAIIKRLNRIHSGDQIDDITPADSSYRELLVENKRLGEQGSENAAKLKIARENADRDNRAKSAFLSSMSHALRTPLNTIFGFSQILEYDTDNPLKDDHLNSIRNIKWSVEHLLQLIEEVMDLAKIEAGKTDISIEKVSINSSIEESITLVKALAQQHDITISLIDPEKQYQVYADLTRLRHIILNLLSNSVKYGVENGVVEIRLSEASDNYLRIEITDNGIGISKDRQADLFQPFNRLGAENTEVEGTGIGLYVAKELLTLMDGRIGFKNNAEQGSVFWFELPLVPEPLIPPAEGVVLLPDVATDYSSLSGKILYIEDNLMNLQLMQGIVNLSSGLTLMSAHNAELGLEMASRQNPDMIILDINLPGMSGLEALEKLKEMNIVPGIPAIALSAAANKEDIAKGLEAGFQKYLTKPMGVQDILQAIKSVLAN